MIPFEQRAVGLRVSRTGGIDQVGRVEHISSGDLYAPGIRRSLVVRDAVLTVSDNGREGEQPGDVRGARLGGLPAAAAPVAPPPRAGAVGRAPDRLVRRSRTIARIAHRREVYRR